MAKIKKSAVVARALEIWDKDRELRPGDAARAAMKEMAIPNKYFLSISGATSMAIKNTLHNEELALEEKQKQEAEAEEERKRKEAEAAKGGAGSTSEEPTGTPEPAGAVEKPPTPKEEKGPNVPILGLEQPISGLLKNFAPKTYMWMWYQFEKSRGGKVSFEDFLEIALHHYFRDRHLAIAVINLQLLPSLTQEQAGLIFLMEPVYGDTEKLAEEIPEIQLQKASELIKKPEGKPKEEPAKTEKKPEIKPKPIKA